MHRNWKMAIASLALTTTATLTGPAAMAATAQDNGSPPPRLRAICARVPNVMLRVERAIARLEGEDDMRGSLAWLQVQIDRANANGRTERATVLENRLEVRTARLELLKTRLDALTEIDALCDRHGA